MIYHSSSTSRGDARSVEEKHRRKAIESQFNHSSAGTKVTTEAKNMEITCIYIMVIASPPSTSSGTSFDSAQDFASNLATHHDHQKKEIWCFYNQSIR